MYNKYFGFSDAPFNITPDPKFLYANPGYREVFATLLCGIRAKKGFVVITAEAGTGKTTLLRELIRNLQPTTTHTAFIFNTDVSFPELLRLILNDLGLFTDGKNTLIMLRKLKDYLVQQRANDQTVAVIVDEGQALSDEAIQGLLLLSHLSNANESLLQIVLAGQPELDSKLDRVALSQLRQRIVTRRQLDALTEKEIGHYIAHRIRIAGYSGPNIFSEEAIEDIWAYSHGNPLMINIVCDNALLLAYAKNEHSVSRTIIDDVAHNLWLKPELKLVKPHTIQVEHSSVRHLPQRMNSNHRWKNKAKAVTTTARLKRNGCQPSCLTEAVSPDFIDRMSSALTEAMGPMAPVVIKHEISMLGESVHNFPSERMAELVELVSRRIFSSGMKTEFKSTMLAEINELEGRRLALQRW